jgi:hypothetical protein
MTSDAKTGVTIAGIVTFVGGGAVFLWAQWRQVGDLVRAQPAVLVLVGGALVAATVFGVVRGVMHRRHMQGRVRRGRD